MTINDIPKVRLEMCTIEDHIPDDLLQSEFIEWVQRNEQYDHARYSYYVCDSLDSEFKERMKLYDNLSITTKNGEDVKDYYRFQCDDFYYAVELDYRNNSANFYEKHIDKSGYSRSNFNMFSTALWWKVHKLVDKWEMIQKYEAC